MLNPDKFQFAEKSVDFAGFSVSDSTIEPLPKYLDAIRDFPSPSFGLVNQVANYAQLRDIMEPFKPFLSPRCKFSWSPELEEALLTSGLKKPSLAPSVRAWRSSTCRDAPVFTQTGLNVVLDTSSSSNTAAAPLAYPTAAPEDGGLPWPDHGSCPLQSNATRLLKGRP